MDANDKTIPNHSMPPVSSGTHGQGDQLLQSGMMLPPQSPGILGVIGKYQVIKILGEGGMGQVVLAREPVTDSMVAIKLIKPEYIHKEWAVHRFLTEARHMFRMSHPSIIRVLDVSDRPEGPYFVMPFMSGGSLAGKIKPGEHLSGETILPVARAVAEALHHAHGRGITHRDLKPANILLDAEGRAHLADFGLLRTFFNDSVVDTSQPQIEGTVPYMSPAVAAGKAEDTRCDIYAFGCLLYEMLTSQPPYQGPTVDAMLRQIQDGPPPPIRQLNPHAHAALTTIAEHAMARELRDRYASMADVVAELDRVAQGHAPVGPHGRERGSGGMRKAMVAAGIVAIVGLIAFVVSKLSGDKQSGSMMNWGDSSAAEKEVVNISDGLVAFFPLDGNTLDATGNGHDGKAQGKIQYVKTENGQALDLDGASSVVLPDEKFLDGTKNATIALWFNSRATSKYRTAFGTGDARGGCDPIGVQFNHNNKRFISCGFRDMLAPFAGGSRIHAAEDTPDDVFQVNRWHFYTMTLEAGSNLTTLRVYIDGELKDTQTKNRAIPIGYDKPMPTSIGAVGNDYNYNWVGSLDEVRIYNRTLGPSEIEALLHTRSPFIPQDSHLNPPGQVESKPDSTPHQDAGTNPPPGTPAAFVEGAFSYTVKDGAVTIVKYTGPGGDVKIPEKIKEVPVGSIGECAFSGCSSLTSVTIPASVATIGWEPFSYCTKLASIVVDAANPAFCSVDGVLFNKTKTALVMYPGGRAGSYAIPSGVNEFGVGAFMGCDKLTSVTIPESMTCLHNGSAFRDCIALTSVMLPQSLTTIENWPFYGCVNLTSLTIPAKVIALGKGVFFGCKNLITLHFEGNAPSLGERVFEGANNVTIYYLPTTKGWGNEFGGRPTAVWDPKVQAGKDTQSGWGRYMVVDLTGGAKAARYPVTYLEAVPAGGWTDEYKTDKLVMRKIEPGAFAMGSPDEELGHDSARETTRHQVNLTKGYYLGVFEVTQRQWELVMGNRPSQFNNATFYASRPVENVGYFTIRENPANTDDPAVNWPLNANVNADSFIGRLRAKTGMASFDLPTEAQWEFACRAGTTTALNNGKNLTDLKSCPNMAEVGRYRYNANIGHTDPAGGTDKVGCRLPNAWGIYDMHGNVYEYCLDWWGPYPTTAVNDPVGAETGSHRVLRGESWNNLAMYCRSAYRGRSAPESARPDFGFRVALAAASGQTGIGGGTTTPPPIVPPASENGASSIILPQGTFAYTAKDGKVTITKYTGPGGNLAIPDKINGLPVTGIGTSAFASCAGLTGVTIPNSVTDIGGTAFYRCAGLTRVNIPASVTTVGDAMFAYGNELAVVTVDPANPNFCSSADGVMFSKDKTCLIACPNGKAGSYEIPRTVTQIRPNAFDGCLKLTTVVIPNGVKRIEGYTFKACTSLTGVTIPESVTSIGRAAFQYCTSLEKITIPNGVTSIEADAFYGCTKLTGVTIPASVTTMGVTPFSGCSEMSAITVDEANPAFTSVDGVLFDKQKTTLLNFPWGKAGTYTIPGGVTKISLRAFAGCAKLTGLTMPATVSEIGDGAFAGCTEIPTLTIPAGVTSIEPDAFFGSSKLATIMVDAANPEFSSTADGVLFNKDKTKLVRCPVSKAGSYVIPNGVTSIERQAFNGCSLLTELTIPDSVTTICDSYVFSGCSRLTRVTIGKGMQSIGKLAFNSCGSLATVRFNGNAPKGEADMTIFNRTVNVTVCCLAGTSGWGKEFGGRPVAMWDPKIPFVFTADNRAIAIVKYTGEGGAVTIPAKINAMPVTRISDNAFNGCTALTGITIPDTVTAIGDGAFAGCTGLAAITLPAGVTSIEPDAILGCGKLAAIMVDPANPAFSSSADGVLFNKDKTKLIRWPVGMAGSYVVPIGVTSIERRAFNGCTGLTDVTIPDSVTTICDDYVFSTCPRLSQVIIGKGITSIGNYTFNSCSGLTGVIIKGNAPGGAADLSIFTKALQATVYYQAGTTGWGKEFGDRPTAVWDPKPPFTYTTARGAVTITKYTGPGGEVAIPDRINGLPVTIIGDNAFYGCATMTAVTIPNSVAVVGAGAFANCASLSKVTIGSAVARIGDSAFLESNGLTAFLVDPANPAFASGKDGVLFDKTMTKLLRCPPGKAGNYIVPAGVTTIGPSAFAGCHSLANVTLSNTVTTIEASAFTNCSRLAKVAISASVTKLSSDAFAQCSRLTAISVDASNPNYSSSADGIVFNKDKTKLVRFPSGKAGNFTIPAGVTQLEPGAFQGTPGLTGVTISAGVTSIPDAAFNSCAQLASVTIPDSVTSIGAWAFGDCPGLKEFTIPKGVTTIGGGAFHGCTGLTSVSIPANVTEVGWMAFGHCYGITSISLANGVAALGDYAFYYCTSLSNITIPASVKSIGINPFRCCFLLDSNTVDASNAAFCSEEGALLDIKKSRLVSCPGGKTGCYEIPKSVTTIGGSAFRGCLKLSTVMLPDGVSDLERRAFKYCTNITEIIFHGNAPKLGGEVFVESAKATIYYQPGTKGWDKTFGDRPTGQWDPKIGYCYTIDKDAVTITKYIGKGGDVTIPGKIGGLPVTTIAEAAFQNCPSLTSLTVPTGVTGITGRAFDGCSGLTKVTLPASVTSMGDYPAGKWNPFVNCPKLASISVAAANPSFRSNADGILFNKEMTTLLAYPGGKAGSYTIPDGVTSIGLAAFEGCADLAEVKIPRGVIALGPYSGARAANPFVNCTKLVSLTVEAENPAYSSNADGVVFNKDKSTLVCFPSGKAGSYDVPDGVTGIGESAFAFCPGLTDLTMPASLTTINAVAFMNSAALAKVCFKGNAPTRVISNAFQGAVNTTVYYLPATTGWGATFAGRPTAVWEENAKAEN